MFLLCCTLSAHSGHFYQTNLAAEHKISADFKPQTEPTYSLALITLTFPGRFLAELTKEVLSDLAASKYQMAEYRISIYGRKQSEWDQLASWIVNNDLYSDNVVWLIQASGEDAITFVENTAAFCDENGSIAASFDDEAG
jgi:adenosine deaminase